MPYNKLAQNVFGTMGMHESVYHAQNADRALLLALRYDLLERPGHPPDLENMADQEHKRSLGGAPVRELSLSPQSGSAAR